MAPLEHAAQLAKRQYNCPGGYYYRNGYCYSSWSWWGRWVLAGVVLFFFIGVLFLLACVRARRRRRAGQQPYYGTGWMAPRPKYGYNGQNNPNAYAQPPPPQYSAEPQNHQYTGTTFNPNDGYYGNQVYGNQEGVQLQQPATSYQRDAGENVYEPPAGPPPGKK